MRNQVASTNESFKFLEKSDEFLQLIINNINSCVLLLDKDIKLRAFNNSLKTIFSNKKDEDLLYRRCGEAIGCAYQIEEAKDCGSTSRCCECDLRESAIKSYLTNQPIYKEHIAKPFFNYENDKVMKHLQFSTRIFRYNYEKYIVMIIEDISKFKEEAQSIE